MSGYHRLDPPSGRGQRDDENAYGHDPYADPRYQAHSPSPFLDPARSPSPSHGQHLQGYEMPQQHQYPPHQPLEIPVGPGAHLDHYTDRLQPQPTVRITRPGPAQLRRKANQRAQYSVENIPNSFGHNEAYNEQHPISPDDDYHRQHSGDIALSPQAHHDAYYNQPYAPSPADELGHYPGYGPGQEYYDEPDDRPILVPDSSYGPDPHQIAPTPEPHETGYMTASGTPAPAPKAAPVKRWKTVKEIQLVDGNLILDCPVPPRLLNQVSHAEPPDRDEFTHMRYSAATCDPSDFYNERFTLRQRLFAKPRHTELFICITMYNEEDELFARTMQGVIKNIEHMNARTKSQTWGEDAWKRIVVCVVSDGRAKINPRTRAVLAGMGLYQDGIAKQQVNGKDVTAHLYEYTTQMALEVKNHVVSVKKGNTPIQMLFCLKEKNQKKINSHRWFFQAFGQVLDPNICVLIDAGTRPGKDSIYQLWKAFDKEPMCAGACGEIKAMLQHGKQLLNPLVAAQNFEYKISNILDKPLESVFGFISVLPGAFSAYRYIALQNDKTGQGPLEKYFAGEKMHGANAGIFTANMYLAEDRILCFELVAKRNCHWILQYVKSAEGVTDVPTEMSDFILQRRRWLNGSFFAAVYALAHFYQIFRSGHSLTRRLMLGLEFTYQTVNQLFAWFAIGNFFLVFDILTTSLSDPALLGTAGRVLGIVFEWLYLVTLVTCFVLALGNRPQGSSKFYLTMVYFWVVLMAYLLFAAIFVIVKDIEKQFSGQPFSVKLLFSNYTFFTLVVSLLSTYVLYFVMSILFLDPWHMLTSFVQYLLMQPVYINILNVYAFCNTHDVTWGTKGDDKPEKLPTVLLPPGKDTVAMNLPTDDHDLNSQYESELQLFSKKYAPAKKIPTASEKQEDYYKGFRSGVVLVWMFCNLGLAAVVLNTGGFDRIEVEKSEDQTKAQNSTIYMSVVLWSVAGLSLVRFLGSFWFLVLRFFRGV
ncbi:MAG: Chitin synthase, class 1 [Chrysothrix sp. TS-e1954]|nr:MAG: Chitin synthase, class 1 [Chrysothrix sp. TS-e1954]